MTNMFIDGADDLEINYTPLHCASECKNHARQKYPPKWHLVNFNFSAYIWHTTCGIYSYKAIFLESG